MKALRVGIIGLGVGKEHLRAYQNHPACHITRICDQNPTTLKSVLMDHPSALGTRTADDLFADKTLDVISIASFDQDHFAHALKALKAGKHIFVEKPLCQTFDQLRQLHSVWLKNKRRQQLASNLLLRKAPLYQELRRFMQKGKFGDVYAMDGDYLYGRLSKLTEGWRSQVSTYSVLAGGGIHLIDLLLWLSQKRPLRTWSRGNRIVTQNTHFRYKDYVSTVLTFPSSMIARITANFGCVHPHQHVVKLYGSKLTFILDDKGARFHKTRDPHKTVQSVKWSALPSFKGVMIADFIDSILHPTSHNVKEVISYFDGMAVVAASNRSLETKKEVDITYL